MELLYSALRSFEGAWAGRMLNMRAFRCVALQTMLSVLRRQTVTLPANKKLMLAHQPELEAKLTRFSKE